MSRGRAAARNWPAALAWVLLALCLGLPGTLVAASEPASPTEDEIKAAFLLNFPKYIEWPPSAFANRASPIVLAVVGDKKLERVLARMAEGKSFNSRPIEVRAVGGPGELNEDCQIVFIGTAERRHAPELIERLKDGSVLTVGEDDDFIAQGGIINLARDNRRIRLEISLNAAETARLKISSKLLRVAEVVKRRE